MGHRIHQLHLCRGIKPQPGMSVLNMTLDHLIMRLQSWNFGEYGVCHYSQVHSDPEVSIKGFIELFIYYTWNYLTVCKQIMLNRLFICDRWQYLKPFCVLVMILNCIKWWGSSFGVCWIWSPSSLLWPGVLVPVQVASIDQIELFNLFLEIIIYIR